jgi:glycosyltransferase involved in cell wall biosynthesis
MKTVFGWSDGGSACEYYRLRVPLDFLHERGDVDRMIGGQFKLPKPDVLPDVVIGQRVNRPDPATLWHMLAAGELGPRPRMIYEIDDDLFNVTPGNPVHRHFKQSHITHTILACVTAADAVTVSTEPLADELRSQVASWGIKKCPPVHVIPNALPHIAYRHEPASLRFGDRTIGWAGSKTHEQDFDQVAEHLGKFLKRNPRWRFLAIGTLFPRVAERIAPKQRARLGWVRDMATYYRTLDKFDVGIIPLADTTFNRSKSDIKFLEYAARQIPIVASRTGPYAEHCWSGRALAGNADLWQHSMRVATTGSQAMVARAFDYAWTRRVDNVADKWLEVINDGG